jgi:hypothetical protein
MERWLAGPLKQSVWVRTYEDYAWLTRKHIVPTLGHVKLKKLTAEHLDELYAEKVQSGLSPRTVNYIHATIRVALQGRSRTADPLQRGPRRGAAQAGP